MKFGHFGSAVRLLRLIAWGWSIFVYFRVPDLLAAPQAEVILDGAAKPLVNFRPPLKAKFRYVGPPDLVAGLDSGATPTAIAAEDFDVDGAMDIVVGYKTSAGDAIAVLRGNVDAYAPQDPSLFKAAAEGKVPATFLPTARLFALPVSPDYLATGDFDGDGFKDVLLAANGGNLYLLKGDGRGNLLAPTLVPLPGPVSALAANDGGQVAVAVSRRTDPELLIFDPKSAGFSSPVGTYPLSAAASSIAWGNLGSGTETDLAVGAGNDLIVIYDAIHNALDDADTSPAASETIPVPFPIQAVTTGNFVWDREARTEIALLGVDGTIQILQHGDLDTRPYTKADFPARRALSSAITLVAARNPSGRGTWTITKQVFALLASPSETLARPMLQSPHLAASPTNDLMTVRPSQNQMLILDTSGMTPSPQASLMFPSAPVAAVSLPQKLNGERDLVVLTHGQSAPTIITVGADSAFVVSWTNDEDDMEACGGSATSGTGADGDLSLREAACEANNSGAGTYTINVPAGTYNLSFNSSPETGEVQLGTVPGAIISVIGLGTRANTTIQQTDGIDRVFNCDPPGGGGVTTLISNLTISGGTDNNVENNLGGAGVIAGGPGDNATYTNLLITNNTTTPGSVGGGGLVLSGGGNLTISNSTISANTAAQSGGGVLFDPGGLFMGNLTITNSVITGNAVNSGTLAGGGLAALVAAGSNATVSGSTFTNNTVNAGAGGGIYSSSALTAINSRIVGNTATAGGQGIYGAGSNVTGIDNWWGCNAGPGNPGCDSTGGSVTTIPMLQLAISASVLTIVQTTGTSTLTADITHDSVGGFGFSIPDGSPITFGGTLGTDSPTSTTTTSGQSTSTYTAGSTPGAATGTATLDNQTVSVDITISASSGPTITSANNATFTVGAAGLFSVTTSGSPTPSITISGATIPSGVTFLDFGNGTGILNGTPAAGTGGSYSFIVTASNANGSTPQSFTFTVDQAPAVTSASSTMFTAGAAGTFSVTTSGFPAPSLLKTVGALPGGVTFSDNGNGTGTLSGTPLTGGLSNLTFAATNNVGSTAQNFVLSVNQAPSFLSANILTVQQGAVGSLVVTALGFPVPGITEIGTLPAGMTFTDHGDSTGTLGGTPSQAGVFPITFTGTNSAGTATQNFTLTITQQLANTGTALSSSPNPSSVNQSVTLTATVSPAPTGIAFGTVSFYDLTTLLGVGNVNSLGVATFSTASLPVGGDSLTAVYSGSSNFAASTSSALMQTVTGARSTTTTLTASPNPAVSGQTVTFTATISPAPIGSLAGMASFYNGSTLLAAEMVSSSGIATLAINTLPAGTLSIMAAYSGNSGSASSLSSTISEIVNTSYTVTAPPTPVTAPEGGSVAIDVTVPPIGGTFDNAVTMSASGLPPGATATFSPQTVTPGSAGASTVLTIQLAAKAESVMDPHRKTPFTSFTFAIGLCGIGLLRKRLSRKYMRAGALGVAACTALMLISITACGGGAATQPIVQPTITTQPGTYFVTITGASGSTQASTTITVMVQ